MTQSNNRSASTGSGFGGAVRRLLRGVVLLLVLLLVASIGLVIGEGSREPAPSAEELALEEASVAADALAANAAALGQTVPVTNRSDYAELVEMFELHALALQPAGILAEPDSGSASPSAGFTPSSSPTTTISSPADLLAQLNASYTRGFEAAGTVAPGPARVLASASTAQWLEARALAGRLDVPVPDIPVPEPRYNDDVAPGCPAETDTLGVEPGLDGARTAVLAEQRASYAYEVAAARATEPGSLLERMAQHENAAMIGSAVLSEHCVAEPLPAAAYELEESLLSEPDAALQELERTLVATYADLVGVSAPGPVRDWALRQLTSTAQRVAESAGGAALDEELEGLPGIDPRDYPRPSEPES